MAKLVPEDATTKAPSKWVSYMVIGTTGTPGRPSTDATGTMVGNGDGTYTYTFFRNITQVQGLLDAYTYTGNNTRADLGDVTYQPNLVHRMAFQFAGAARGTGSNTPDGVTVATSVNMENPINVNYDFVPATGAPVAAGADIRDVISINKCNECHDKLAFHGGGRVEARYCVVCHTDQRKYGYAEATTTATGYSGDTRKINGGAAGDMTAMAHRIHMGNGLTKTGYNYANVLFDKLGYSMLDNGVRMCAKCHSDVPQAANWKTKPTRLACGTCHDGVAFATGHGPGVPAQNDDAACAICHLPADVATYHQTLNVTKHNPTVAAGLTNFTYEISSATQTVSGGDVVIKFRIMQSTDGSTPAPVVFPAPTTPWRARWPASPVPPASSSPGACSRTASPPPPTSTTCWPTTARPPRRTTSPAPSPSRRCWTPPRPPRTAPSPPLMPAATTPPPSWARPGSSLPVRSSARWASRATSPR
ncbi:MAG: OmcA/MtrC family decaheme c-type cytochrome [Holophagaceae bacterium]|nr:OmcA/MtrC family decaheme c-type cytochrome [Holophagaceae bacterium]